MNQPNGPQFDEQITRSFERLADTMPTEKPLAHAAMTEAGGIQRRRTAYGIAGAAAALAIAVPLAWTQLRPDAASVPAGSPTASSAVDPQALTVQTQQAPEPSVPTIAPPPVSSPAPSVKVPSNGPTTTAGGTSTAHTTPGTVNAASIDIPYISDGSYHGASGTFALPANSRVGVGGALRIAGGTLVVNVQMPGAPSHLDVVSNKGVLIKSIPGDFGAAVTNRTGDRWAVIDSAGKITLRDSKGAVLATATPPSNAVDWQVTGFSGRFVYLSSGSPMRTALWDTGHGLVDYWGSGQMIAANDTASRAVMAKQVNGNPCWTLVQTGPEMKSLGGSCHPGEAIGLSGDASKVITRTATGAQVLDAKTGKALFAAKLQNTQRVAQADIAVASGRLVMSVVNASTGDNVLVTCTPTGACANSAPVKQNPGYPEAMNPYVLVRS